jgi:putative CocE/NonD family hydrolase
MMKQISRLVTLFPLAFFASLPAQAHAQGLAFVQKEYVKHEYRIPMRDGIKLFTVVYTPKDESEPHPILMERTPYCGGPYGEGECRAELGPSRLFAEAHYILVYQDVRGCFMSEGQFLDIRPQRADQNDPKAVDESTDACDTIDWLVKNVPNNNGKVGLWGISYPGFYAAAGAIDAHPALAAVSPQAPLVDCFMGDDTHHNGALFLHQEFNFDAVFGLPRPSPTPTFGAHFDHGTPDAYAFFLKMGPLPGANDLYFKNRRAFWNDVMNHGTYDAFWKARNLLPHLKSIRPAVMTVGGWFDAEDLYGPLHAYRAIETSSPSATNTLVMGPWHHGGWNGNDGRSLGPIQFGSNTASFYQRELEFPFFDFHLRGKGEWSPPEAWVFETGQNAWHKHTEWPPRQAKPAELYLRADGRLSLEPTGGDSDAKYDEFISDPAKPVPYTNTISIDCPNMYMVEDQRFVAKRPDVSVYQTEPLEKALTVVGPIDVELSVSTSGTDGDWVVKLIDVFPDDEPEPAPNVSGTRMGGYQQLVRGDVMRGRFRESFERPRPFQPGKPSAVRFPLQDIYHTFRPRHRIMVQVQCTWFPLVDRNPQSYVDIYNAKEIDFRRATQRIYHTRELVSRLKVQVMP